MKFAVPQFIEVEDKIFGPLTLKQAIYVAGGAGLVLSVFTRAGFFWAIVTGLPVGIIAFALAFAKVNNRPFVHMLYSASFYAVRNKLYLWKKIASKKKTGADIKKEAERNAQPVAPKLSQSRLKEIAWSLDTRESLYTKEDQWKQ